MVEAGGIGEGGRATAGEEMDGAMADCGAGGGGRRRRKKQDVPCVNFWTEWREFSYDGLVSFYMLIFLYQSLINGKIVKPAVQFLSVEFVLTYIRDLQYRTEISSHTSIGGKAK